MEKTCTKCGDTKPVTEFYKHPNAKDGRDNSCKECRKELVRKNRNNNLEYYREYDRLRGNRQTIEYTREYRRKNSGKYRAHNMVNNAIRDGKLYPEPCCKCGHEKSHAHHDDYAKPLNVRWLCPACHKAWHKEHGEAPNGN